MSHFFAYLDRLKLIRRWGLMRNIEQENDMEHSMQTAMIAHGLAVLGNRRYGRSVNPETVVTMALYHDASEALTGDLPTPIKYYNPEIRNAYKEVERIAGNRLLDMLPQELRASYEHYVLEDDAALEPFVKAADKLSAHIKCLEEQKAGNTEFDSAAKQTMASMEAMDMPELSWFIANCLEPFALNLDQL